MASAAPQNTKIIAAINRAKNMLMAIPPALGG